MTLSQPIPSTRFFARYYRWWFTPAA
jgi:hypothetical protein